MDVIPWYLAANLSESSECISHSGDGEGYVGAIINHLLGSAGLGVAVQAEGRGSAATLFVRLTLTAAEYHNTYKNAQEENNNASEY